MNFSKFPFRRIYAISEPDMKAIWKTAMYVLLWKPVLCSTVCSEWKRPARFLDFSIKFSRMPVEFLFEHIVPVLSNLLTHVTWWINCIYISWETVFQFIEIIMMLPSPVSCIILYELYFDKFTKTLHYMKIPAICETALSEPIFTLADENAKFACTWQLWYTSRPRSHIG